jgi:nicotinate-nucleotide pyrophosphorylase (carboxylating)
MPSSERLGTGCVDVVHEIPDGAAVQRGDVIARFSGATRTILIAERTLLNILSRLSGVATHTRRWADELAGSGAMVLDTRKTTPGIRASGEVRRALPAAARTSAWGSTTSR